MLLPEKTTAGAALDIIIEEPPTDADLLSLPNLTVTPHTSGNAREPVEAMGCETIKHLVLFLENL
jgi:phosphoglycerate dehydrogenase-like enzyme